MNNDLSPHFSLREFLKSNSADEMGLDNSLRSPALKSNLIALCANILEPLRFEMGLIRITSGYRCPTLNARIGGARSSQHTKGEAADIVSDTHSPKSLALWIVQNCEFDQVIVEFDSWVHVSYSQGHNRSDELRAIRDPNGRTSYTVWEHE